MAKAKKLKSGSWRCLVYDYTDNDGKRHYKSFTSTDSTAKGKRDAELMAAEYATEKERCLHINVKFSEALENYINTKDPVLSPSTIRCYKNIQTVLKRDYKKFCAFAISDISGNEIQKIINSISEDKAPKTVRNYHGLISAVLKDNGYDRILLTSLPQKVRPDLYIPSDKDIKALINCARGTELEIPIMLGAFGTMRRGEICGLSMNDIEGNIIHVHHCLVEGSDKKLHLKSPKTYSSDRYVDVPDFIIEKINEKGYITKLKPHSITSSFRKLLERNNIPLFRFHDLRHYSASIQHALGIPDAYIMKRGGWASDSVLKSVYRHTMSDRQKEMNDIANNHFSELCNTKCNTTKKSAE